MTSPSDAERAAELISEALRLLGEAGNQRMAGSHLNLALDLLQGDASHLPGDQIDQIAASDELAMDRAAVRALGGTFTILASVLGRSGIISMQELAGILAIYATATSETDPPQGLLIACWAGMLREAAEHCETPQGEKDLGSPPGV